MMTSKADAAWIARALVHGSPVRIGEPDLTELVRALRPVEFAPGTVLYSRGKRPKGIWILRSGCVEISEGTGPSRSVVTVCREGDVIGDLYVLLSTTAPFTARCTERTECWSLPGDKFRRLLAAYPSLSIAWLCNLAGRLSQARTRVGQVLGRSLPQRLARFLLEEGVDGTMLLPQRTIAQMLGVQRTSVNKTLKEFEGRGIIELGYGSVTVVDEEALRHIALDADGSSNGSSADVAVRLQSVVDKDAIASSTAAGKAKSAR